MNQYERHCLSCRKLVSEPDMSEWPHCGGMLRFVSMIGNSTSVADYAGGHDVIAMAGTATGAAVAFDASPARCRAHP